MCNRTLFDKIAIVGVGLIGGSLGMAIIRKSLAKEVVGIGRSRESMDAALACGAVHRVSSELNAVAGAGLIIVATPVSATLKILEELNPFIAPGAIITDVGSTKAEILKGSGNVLPGGIYFIGGHPMAGS